MESGVDNMDMAYNRDFDSGIYKGISRIMKILIACEFSGVVRDAFLRKGHAVISCDLLPTERPNYLHYQGDVFDIINDGFDLMIAHPPCTYLCSSGLHWNKNNPERQQKTVEALFFVKSLLNANIPKIALENPVGCLSTAIRKPDQYIQPYEYGHNASKKTGLWLKGLPKLKPTLDIPGRQVDGKTRWDNQTDSGQNKLGPSPERAKDRARTYQGIADAMANQWTTNCSEIPNSSNNDEGISDVLYFTQY